MGLENRKDTLQRVQYARRCIEAQKESASRVSEPESKRTMTNQQKLTLLALLSVAIIFIILISNGLSQLHLHSGDISGLIALLTQDDKSVGSAAPVQPQSDSSLPLGILRPIFWVLLIGVILYAVVSPRFRKSVFRAFIVVLVLLLLLNRLPQNEAIERESEPSGGIAGLEVGQVAVPEPPAFVTDPPGWFVIGANVLLVLLLLGGLWLVWRMWRREPDTQTLLVQEIESALSDLEAGDNLSDVVLRCYARMSQVLRKSKNIERHHAMTPREFERHLAEIGMQDEHIQRLTRLFEGVRYGAQPSGGRTEREALACLTAIVQTYGNE